MKPPLTSRHAPVINDASSEARNRAAFAISCGEPNLPSGMFWIILSWDCGSQFSVMGVNVGPGAMALTVILYCPSAFANDLVKPTTPALEAV